MKPWMRKESWHVFTNPDNHMKLVRSLIDMAALMQLPKSKRRMIFYSEGKANWPHLEGLLLALLDSSDIHVCYVSSGADDPGLFLQHPRLTGFQLDEGWIRNWFFANVDTDVLVMTMPDLETYQIKRSQYPVHYVYVHHSLVSCHMVYRPGAFDHFDTIFCAGPHHEAEIRALEVQHQLKPKHLVQHGYGRLDAILAHAENHTLSPQRNHILIAPSWGEHGLIETMGNKLVSHLLANNYAVTLRPHPQTVKFSAANLKKIQQQHKDNPLFTLETNIAGQSSLHQSTLMVSDWSGAALDYAFGLHKPVLFIDIPRKINNPDYASLGITPFEVMIRDKIGKVVPLNEIDNLSTFVESMITQTHWKTTLSALGQAHAYNVGNSGHVGARALMELLS